MKTTNCYLHSKRPEIHPMFRVASSSLLKRRSRSQGRPSSRLRTSDDHESTPLLHPEELDSNFEPPVGGPQSDSECNTSFLNDFGSDADQDFADVCFNPRIASAGIGFRELQEYVNKLSKGERKPWATSKKASDKFGQGAETAKSPDSPESKGPFGSKRKYRFPVLGSEQGRRYMFFSMDAGVVYTQNLEQLIVGGSSEHLKDLPSVSPGPSGAPPLQSLLTTKATWWIDVLSPTMEDMKILSRVFHIHPLTSEDIFQSAPSFPMSPKLGRGRTQTAASSPGYFDTFNYATWNSNITLEMEPDTAQDTREKVEVFSNYYFVCIKSFDHNQYSSTYMNPFNVYMLIFETGIISFHFKPCQHPKNVIKRITQLMDFGFNLTASWINYALMDDIVDGYIPAIRMIEREVDAIDDLVLYLESCPGSEQSDMLRRVGNARKTVMLLLRLLSTKPDVVKALVKRVGLRRVGNETALYLGDIQDHVITMLQNLQYYDKTLARSHSNYLAQISIEITQSSEAVNNVVAKLTALASIVVPLNLVTGLWGMNVKVPGQEVDSQTWFWSIVGGMVVMIFLLFLWVRRGGIV
ncbi:cora-like Mg2+ transporter protein-domain-containing protein [Paraphysoderma sedebokerense]|nr:cora-like Mg2+ transporter protein-domain-containing protein [Paraphysoderma sedebokerense]